MNWLIYFLLDSFEMAYPGSMGKYDGEKFDPEGSKMKV